MNKERINKKFKQKEQYTYTEEEKEIGNQFKTWVNKFHTDNNNLHVGRPFRDEYDNSTVWWFFIDVQTHGTTNFAEAKYYSEAKEGKFRGVISGSSEYILDDIQLVLERFEAKFIPLHIGKSISLND